MDIADIKNLIETFRVQIDAGIQHEVSVGEELMLLDYVEFMEHMLDENMELMLELNDTHKDRLESASGKILRTRREMVIDRMMFAAGMKDSKIRLCSDCEEFLPISRFWNEGRTCRSNCDRCRNSRRMR